MRRAGLLLVLLLLPALAIPAPADAAFPGKNGKIAFEYRDDNPQGVFTANPDGSGVALFDQGINPHPAWSADGMKMAYMSRRFDGITIANSDGTGAHDLPYSFGDVTGLGWSPDGRMLVWSDFEVSSDAERIVVAPTDGSCCKSILTAGQPYDRSPSWSPDGSRIAFSKFGGDIYTIKPDGSDLQRITTHVSHTTYDDPNWSPDGSKLAVAYWDGGSSQRVSTINADGSGFTPLTSPTPSSSDLYPAWSPDGTKIVFTRFEGSDSQLHVVNVDGTGEIPITTGIGDRTYPDWQPIPINGYARPKGATPFQTYLTVAYKPCASPNEQHGAPLAVLSCSPPQEASDFLTVGTLDANDQAAKAVGSVRYDVKPGNALTPTDEADVKVNVSIKDVRMKSDLSDYSGELGVTSSRRITDKLNTPAPDGTTGAATTQDTPFSITVPCAPTTADDTIGSLCALSTTADAIVPGQVKEEMRSNWELGQVQVYDGGADSDADTTADNTLFMDEGVFVP